MYHLYGQGDKETEYCFNVETSKPLSENELSVLKQLLADGFILDSIKDQSEYQANDQVIELGPRLNFATAFSTNAVAICKSCGLDSISRVERSRRYKLPENIDADKFVRENHDRMTEFQYQQKLNSFETGLKPEPVFVVPLIEQGPEALKKINQQMGLGMDDWDINYYYDLFVNKIGRNPTNVECFQLGQANSEHSRHWFFKGKLIIDEQEMPQSLMELVSAPLKANPKNSAIAFKDNSSAIKGYQIETILPEKPGFFSKFKKEKLTYHIIFTAETHNFPSGVAPFPGAETGGGGRIRDVNATGSGSLVLAGTAGYCVGNLQIPGYDMPWEEKLFMYPDNLATPLNIEIQASNGASDYGNKFGEPLIQGFTRSFGLILPNSERREWLKPIMFSGGVGQIDARHVEKRKPEPGMLIVQIGGPAYRIGMGGGSASSMIQGENVAELDFNAVQRGDAEMEQKMNRVIRACVEMGNDNPIISIHDQGAGGPCNVLTELIEPVGGKIEIRKIRLGDKTLSVLEIWGAEYQERDALLIKPERIKQFEEICHRERADYEILGKITGDGKVVVYDESNDSTPVELDLEKILGKMPQKVFKDKHLNLNLNPLEIPANLSFENALNNVLHLVGVGSKGFLVHKVDRSVTGLIAQQQCAGPLQLTVADVSVIAQSHFSQTGAAISIGEQPNKIMIDPKVGARMSVAEALTNIVWAKISNLQDIKCSGNWMWAAKLPGEGANLYDAAKAVSEIMIDLGIAIDGGKDSLSMAAKVGQEIVKSPSQLVVSAYATVPDINKVITPDIKNPGQSSLWLIDLGLGQHRLGGSALAQTLKQIGNQAPDVNDPEILKQAFFAVQDMIDEKVILAGHDRSDGGLITTLLEMAFSGNCGLEIDFDWPGVSALEYYFNEELGLVVEVTPEKEERFKEIIEKYNLIELTHGLGRTISNPQIIISYNQRVILDQDMRDLRQVWQETSYQLERMQTNHRCADQEKINTYDQKSPEYKLTFEPLPTAAEILNSNYKPKVAIIREEGSNGDREMTSAFYLAGFEVWDITMTDLLNNRADLADFRGVVFVGGFSYADTLGSAKGWASTIRFSDQLKKMFNDFYNRADTFSLGVCNGCQLMGLLGWVPWQGIADEKQPRFVRNTSGRFESRWITLQVQDSPAIMLKDMAGTVLGAWVAHGEGRLQFPDETILEKVKNQKLVALNFVDDQNQKTENYPFNPNGSPEGITGLCSPDGRHFAMMPHPERSFLKWQFPYLPKEWQDLPASPWLKMFQNAYKWCQENTQEKNNPKSKPNNPTMTYAQTGINYGAMDPFKIAAQTASKATAKNIVRFNLKEVGASRGESAYLIEADDCYFAHVEEGLGTKNIVAEAMQKLTGQLYFDKIAQDGVAMIINDMITLGALPISLEMHLAVGDSNWFNDTARSQNLIEGWKKACNLARCAWGGGETPTLKDIVNPETILLSGSALGLIKPKDKIITGNIQDGDAIIIFKSSGIHANGITLARKIAEKLPAGYLTPLDNENITFGEAILEPTIIYVPIIEDCQKAGINIHYASNITGHGWRKIMRASEPFIYVIETIPTPQPIFDFLQKHGPINDEEAYSNLNMGAGFVLFVPEKDVAAVLSIAEKNNLIAIKAGHVEKQGTAKKVIIKPKGITLDGDTLKVR
ncbi:MAG: phosphoribosylformylglycinamidine synthase [Patescibacteria group bacterium]